MIRTQRGVNFLKLYAFSPNLGFAVSNPQTMRQNLVDDRQFSVMTRVLFKNPDMMPEHDA
jgi:hypothetical protein